MVYDLPLLEERVKLHHVTTLHLVCGLSFTVTGAIIAIYNYTIPFWGGALLVAGLITLGFTIFKNKWMTARKINLAARIKELIISLAVMSYSIVQHWKFPAIIFGILSAALVFALYWERAASATLFVHVDDNGLKLPLLKRRFIHWWEVEELVLRFGILTINCTNNHFFQWSVSETDFDDETFQQFCNRMIEENIGKRRNDDW